MPKKPLSSRVPAAVGSIPVVGDLVRSADQQARWMQELVEQNARLVGQLPATVKSFNDALERFNQTVGRLDAAVTRIEAAGRTLAGPLDRVVGVAAALDPQALREIPDTLESLRRETVPALRAAVDTQRQVAVLQNTIERVVALLPGAGLLRRRSSGGGGGDRPTPPAG